MVANVGSIVPLSAHMVHPLPAVLELICDTRDDLARLDDKVEQMYEWMNREGRRDWMRRRRVRNMGGLR